VTAAAGVRPTFPHRPAVQSSTRHRHYRMDGHGFTEHQHVVRARTHEHRVLELRSVHLGCLEFDLRREARPGIAAGALGVAVAFLALLAYRQR